MTVHLSWMFYRGTKGHPTQNWRVQIPILRQAPHCSPVILPLRRISGGETTPFGQEERADVNGSSWRGVTPLLLASGHGHVPGALDLPSSWRSVLGGREGGGRGGGGDGGEGGRGGGGEAGKEGGEDYVVVVLGTCCIFADCGLVVEIFHCTAKI